MVEIFRTNIDEPKYANRVIELIHKSFNGYQANFDLEDRDRILRIECTSGQIQPLLVINFLKNLGFRAELLPDENPTVSWESLTIHE